MIRRRHLKPLNLRLILPSCAELPGLGVSLSTARSATEERTSKGFITVEKAPFVCDGTASELAAVLAPGADSEDPIRRPLPNSEASIYDALIDCL